MNPITFCITNVDEKSQCITHLHVYCLAVVHVVICCMRMVYLQVHNHTGACVVVVSLVTHDEDRPRPHPHTLVGNDCRQGVCTKKVRQNLDRIQYVYLHYYYRFVLLLLIKKASMTSSATAYGHMSWIFLWFNQNYFIFVT